MSNVIQPISACFLDPKASLHHLLLLNECHQKPWIGFHDVSHRKWSSTKLSCPPMLFFLRLYTYWRSVRPVFPTLMTIVHIYMGSMLLSEIADTEKCCRVCGILKMKKYGIWMALWGFDPLAPNHDLFCCSLHCQNVPKANDPKKVIGTLRYLLTLYHTVHWHKQSWWACAALTQEAKYAHAWVIH